MQNKPDRKTDISELNWRARQCQPPVHPNRSGPLLLALSICLTLLTTLTCAADSQEFVTGVEFQRLLNRPLLTHRDYSPLRGVLQRFSEDRHIPICLDRRIDPERLVFVDLQAAYFDTGIADLVKDLPADVVVVGDSVCVTTTENARTLRTRIALAEQFFKDQSKASLGRQLDVARRMPAHWDQLTTPRDLLVEISDRYETTIENPEAIPHDLWAAGDLSHPNLTEALLWIATQYDLEIEWVDSDRVKLVPLTPEPAIEQDHLFRGRSRSEAVKLVKEAFPELPVRAIRDRLRVNGLLEDQEAVAVLLGNRPARKPTVPVVEASLANRRFTLTMINRPFAELLDVLEKQEIQFDRHETQLREAGINLQQLISLKLEDATIEKLFTEACAPLGLTFQIDGTRIELYPVPQTTPAPEK